MLKENLDKLTAKYGEKVLHTPNNKISLAITLTNLDKKVFQPNNVNATFFGAYLF